MIAAITGVLAVLDYNNLTLALGLEVFPAIGDISNIKHSCLRIHSSDKGHHGGCMENARDVVKAIK